MYFFIDGGGTFQKITLMRGGACEKNRKLGGGSYNFQITLLQIPPAPLYPIKNERSLMMSIILSILKLVFAGPVLLRLPMLIVLLSYGILFVHLSPVVVSLICNLLSSLFIKLCSLLLWLILMRWKDLVRGY